MLEHRQTSKWRIALFGSAYCSPRQTGGKSELLQMSPNSPYPSHHHPCTRHFNSWATGKGRSVTQRKQSTISQLRTSCLATGTPQTICEHWEHSDWGTVATMFKLPFSLDIIYWRKNKGAVITFLIISNSNSKTQKEAFCVCLTVGSP